MNDIERLRWFDPGLAVCRDLAGVDNVIRAGLPVTALVRVAERHGLTGAELACVLGVLGPYVTARRTVARRGIPVTAEFRRSAPPGVCYRTDAATGSL